MLTAAAVQAGSIEISPVRVDLSARARVSVLSVRNTGEDETVMQVSVIRWSAEDAANAFEPAVGLLVTPTTFRLSPGAVQVVRVGLRNAPPADTEMTYRLIIEEVPAVQDQDTTQMRMVVRHDLPVFVAPLAAVQHRLDLSMDCSAQGTVLTLRNSGNSHLKVVRITLQAPATDALQADWKTFEYLLPGSKKQWPVSALSALAANTGSLNYLAKAYTEQGSFSADVQNPCP